MSEQTDPNRDVAQGRAHHRQRAAAQRGPVQRAVEATQPIAVLCLRMLADALACVRQFKRQPPAVAVPRLIMPTDLGGNGKG